MSNSQNEKLKELFLEECTTAWRCPYCGGPSAEEWPVCCGENHCEKTLVSPDDVSLGPVEGDLDEDLVESEFQEWLKQRGEP